jgi:HEAT repeat protein
MKEKVMDLIEGEDSRTTKLKNVIRIIKDNFEPDNEGDTLQGFQHFETVDKNLVNLIVKTDKVNEFSNMELFLLGASAYLHDLLKPSSTWGPLTHGGKVMKTITDNPALYGLDNRAEAIAIGWISAAHSSRSLDNTEWGRVPEKHPVGSGEVVELRKLAAIFLLVDTLDTTTLRAPEIMRHIHYPKKFPDEKTEGKWMARQSITGWYIKDGRIVLNAYPMSFDEREAVLIAKTMMEKDLSEVKPLLKSLGFPSELELEMQDIFLKEKAVAEIHEATPFKGMDFYGKGMDFYGESDVELFKGRENDVRRVEEHIYTYPITLLAGRSGVGKTSLIHAGLFPKLKISGWECVYLRPFGDLSKMVESIKRRYGMEAENLADAFRNLDEKQKKKILVVVDQFEEVLNWHAEMFEKLVLDFCSIYGLINPKLLIVLRSDALCDLNRKIFKEVMPSGVPTVELGGLSCESAKEVLSAGFKAGKMTLHPPEFIDEILNDLIEISPFDEIYPPYIQMVGEELCKHADEKRKLILRDTYYELGRAREIVTKYLFRKLDDFGEDKENAITILKCLVSYAGGKAQKSVSKIEVETVISKKELEELLKRLVNERMIRKLDGAIYEIIHDHFGELINKELVGEKERHIKYLREQLNAAIFAFERNKTLMHCQILAELYRHRKEIPVDELAYKVLLASWCAHQFPIWYWLRNAESKKVIEIAIELCEHPQKGVKVGARDLLATALINEGYHGKACKLLTHENELVRAAAVNALAKLGSREDLPLVKKLLKDDHWTVREAAVSALAMLGSREDLPLVKELIDGDHCLDVREAAVSALAKLGNREDFPIVFEISKLGMAARSAMQGAFDKIGSKENVSIAQILLKCGYSLLQEAAVSAIVMHGMTEYLPLVKELLKDDNSNVRKAAVNALAKLGSREDVPLVKELIEDDDSNNVRAAAVNALAKLGSREDVSLVKELLKDDDWHVREAAINALAKLGSREDVPLVKELIENDRPHREAAVNALAKLGSREDVPLVKELLKDFITRAAAFDALVELGSEDDLDFLAELSVEKCAVMKEPMKALGKLDWKLYSPYPLSEEQG